METQNNNARTFLILLVITVIILLVNQTCHNRNKNRLVDDLTAYKDTAYTYKTKHNKLVAYNQVLEVENTKQIKLINQKDKEYSDLLKKYKDIDASVIVHTITVIQKDTIYLDKLIPCDFEPIVITKKDPFYLFKATLSQDKFIIDSLAIPNTQKIVVGVKRVGWFRKERRAEIINSNPLIHTESIGGYVVSKDKKWFETDAFKIGASFVGGFALAKMGKN